MNAPDTTAAESQPIIISPPPPPGIDPTIFAARLALEDAQRARAERIDMIAISAFTLVDDDHPDGLVVLAGEELQISAFDEARYTGKLRRKRVPNPSAAAIADGRRGAPS